MMSFENKKIEIIEVVDGKSDTGTSPVHCPWWSFGKPALAAATLALVREEKLELDTLFHNKPYTLRQLLQHTSGLPDYGGFKEYHEAVAKGDAPWSVEKLLEKVNAEKPLFEPGTRFSYSNIGYLFIRQEIERTTGKKLAVSLNELVFSKLDLDDIRVADSQADLENVLGVQASYHPGWVYHGLLVSALSSSALFLDRLLNTDFLSPKHKTEMLSPYLVTKKIPGRPFENPSYGLGLMIGMVDGKLYAGHTGQGPESTIAVYTTLNTPQRRSIASFVESNGNKTQGEIEEEIFKKLVR